MQLGTFVEALQADLAAIAAVGDDPTAEAARRLIGAIRASAGLRLLDALGEAALELSTQLPSGHVDVRLVGQDPQLVYVEDERAQAASSGEDALTARITLRVPEGLKASVEVAASREGVSVNTWLVRALARAVASGLGGGRGGPRVGNRLTGFGRS